MVANNNESVKKPEVASKPARRLCLGRDSEGELHNEHFDSDGPWDRICKKCKSSGIYKKTLE